MPYITAAGYKQEIQAILLDKDGTLLDFVYTWGRWGEYLLAFFSRELENSRLAPLDPNLLAQWGVRYDEHGAICDYDRNGPLSMGTVDELLTLLAWEGCRRGLSWAEAKLLAAAGKRQADERLEQERAVRLLAGVVPFLESCREAGVKLGLVTADDTSAAERHLEWAGIRHYFSVCMGADQVEKGKPYPDMVNKACERLGVPASASAVIGDTNGDMLMARFAGAAAIGLNLSGSGGAAGNERFPDADLAVASYNELGLQRGE